MRSLALRLIVLTLLSACSGEQGGVGVGGTGSTPGQSTDTVAVSASGPINGFGSVLVNGVKFDDSAATVVRDGVSTSVAALRLGMTIDLTGRQSLDGLTASAEQIRIFSELKGIVQSTGVDTLTVLGTTIRLNSRTVIEGVASAGAIKAGDLVEVYGLRSVADGSISATRVEVETVSSSQTVSVILAGAISSLNQQAKTFQLNGQLVHFGQALVTGSLDNLVRVDVRATTSTATGLITATAVTVQIASAVVENRNYELEASVTDFINVSSFKLAGLAMDASSASLPASQVARLANGVHCEIKGVGRTGVVRLTALDCESSSESFSYEVSGSVTRFVSRSDFTARNQVIDASTATIEGRLADLRVGARIEAKGPVVNGVLKANSLHIE